MQKRAFGRIMAGSLFLWILLIPCISKAQYHIKVDTAEDVYYLSYTIDNWKTKEYVLKTVDLWPNSEKSLFRCLPWTALNADSLWRVAKSFSAIGNVLLWNKQQRDILSSAKGYEERFHKKLILKQ